MAVSIHMVHSVLPSQSIKSLKLPQRYRQVIESGIHEQKLIRRLCVIWMCVNYHSPKRPEPLYFFQITKDPFVVRKCTLLVLRPDIFLPDNRPLLINTARTLRDPGGPYPSKSQRSSWIPYYSESHLSYLVDSSNRSSYDFDFKSLRQPQDSLSIFALLVNTNSKLQNITQTSQSAILYTFRSVC